MQPLILSLLFALAAELPDIQSVAPDLTVPPVENGSPAPGKRVRQATPEWSGTDVHHLVYLPEDWRPGKLYPVIVEYAGNGPYNNRFGDVSYGTVEGSKLGYGLSGGKGYIWISMPYVNTTEKRNQTQWWGDIGATVDYCRKTVRRVCEQYGGDPSAVILTGFSRGAIACNYIGLNDDEIADIWLAFLPYSHYDGVRLWGYEAGHREAALARLRRLKGRAQFIVHEASIDATREYIESTGIRGLFTFLALPFRNHNDAWTLRDIPARRQARSWLKDVMERRPGTQAISGVVRTSAGQAAKGLRVESGPSHWTKTDDAGKYVLRGLTTGRRIVKAGPSKVTVELSDRDVSGVDFRLELPSADKPEHRR